MCLQPKYITNRCLHYDLYKPLKIQVPCGKCEECKNMVRNEWFTRCYYEWRRHQNSTFFYTLTYNNDNLPMWNGIQHFSKQHIQLFLKRLRVRLAKYDIKLKYLVSCEFGERYHRCHYHALFFLDKKFNPYWFLRFVEDSWQYGFVRTGDNTGIVNSPNGIQYVTKYVTKDFSHLDEIMPTLSDVVFKRYKTLETYVRNRWNIDCPVTFRMNDDFTFSRVILAKCSQDDLDFVQKFLTKVRRIVRELTPFHLQSTRLGSNIVDYCDKTLDKVPLLQSSGNVKMATVPRYIKRMLWYDCVEGENSHKKDSFVLSELGKAHYFQKLDSVIQKDKENYENVIVNCSTVDNSIIPYLNKIDIDFKHVRDIVYWCQHFDLDLEVLSIYKNVFRGRVNEFDIVVLSNDVVKDSWKDIAYQSIYAIPQLDFGEICKNQSLITCLNSCLWNLHPFFQVYEDSLVIFDAISNYNRKVACASRVTEEKERRKLRQYYKCLTN